MNNDKDFFETPEFRMVIKRYEQMKAENICSYFDTGELADILSYYLRQGCTKEAKEVFETAVRLHRRTPETLKMKARIELAEGMPSEALRTVEEIGGSNDTDLQLLKADILLSLKDYKAARYVARTILQQCNITDEIAYDALEIMLDCGFAQEVLDITEKGLQYFPSNRNLLEIFAEALIEIQKTDKAIEVYNLLLDENPYSSFYWEQLGHIYYMIERYGKALECFEYELTIDDNIEYARMMQAYCYFKLGNYNECIAIFHSLTSKYPDSIMPLFYIALSHSHNGECNIAMEIYRRIIEINKEKERNGIESALSLINMAIIYDNADMEKDADQCMEVAMQHITKASDSKQLLLCHKKDFYELRDKENMTFRDMNTTETKEWELYELFYSLSLSLIKEKKYRLALYPLYIARDSAPDTSDIDACIAYILYIHNGDKIEISNMIRSAIEGKSNTLFELFGIRYDANMGVQQFIKEISNR